MGGVVAPFLFVSLLAPAWTGPLGQFLCNSCYSAFGVTSMLCPILTMGWALRLLLPKRHRALQLTWAASLLWLNLDLIAQRMGGQGGNLGQLVDGLLLHTIGPAGAWFVAALCLPISAALVCRVHPLHLAQQLVQGLHAGVDHSHKTLDRMTRPSEDSLWTTPLEAPPRTPRQPLLLPFEEPKRESPSKAHLLRPAPRLDVESEGSGLVGLKSRAVEDSVQPTRPRPVSSRPEPVQRERWPEALDEHLLAPTSPIQEVIDPQLWREAGARPKPTPASLSKVVVPPARALPVARGELSVPLAVAPARNEPRPVSTSDEVSASVSLEATAPEVGLDSDEAGLTPSQPSEVDSSEVDSSEVDSSEVESAELDSMEENPSSLVHPPETLAEPESSEAAAWESFEPAPLPSVELPSAPVDVPRLPVVAVEGEQLRLFPSLMEVPVARYRCPSLSLLNEPSPTLARRPIEDKSQILLDALESFGVQAHLLGITRGPAVTRYELQPARGVKVARFTSLTNDIALALAATAVRIEAPIPGKAAIGIEIPNDQTDLVVLKDILGSSKFRKSVGLSYALGKDLQGDPTFANLQKMPHLLVAGTTGSGKSVCVNALILSLLYRFTPNQLQLLMIDPKQVELSIYEGIPHLIGFARGAGSDRNLNEGNIICDPKRAALALHQVVELMEHRYGQFAAARVRNLEEYNLAAEDPLPWVVVIIDELADLMMVASKSVETSICRIAQKARAAGIHLVLATQRPSADVITGLIKVNIPSRIAFAVSSQVDSRVILDTGGAEQLLGKGDMLFCPVDASDPRRIQGCYVTNEEILRVVEFWKDQGTPDNLIALTVADVPDEAAEDEEGSEDDQLVEQALEVVLRRKQASASLLQTELKVGYARARRLVYLMEKKGYIGPADGSKPRQILYNGT